MIQNIQKQIDYFTKITDKIGIIEHCYFDKPNYSEGYCVDDNARALQICLKLKNDYPEFEKVIPVYFNFLKSAFQKNQLFNDLNPDLIWQKNFEVNGEHYGRTLAALGEYGNKDFFNQIYSLYKLKKSPHLRVSAQVICALKYYHSTDIKLWANSLVESYLKEKTTSWHWFESTFTYDNARLPFALFIAYQNTNNSQYLQIALESLDFLTKSFFDKKNNYFIFPGNNGVFGQQPIEAGCATEAYSLAFKITKNIKYSNLAQKSFAWYHGQNILNKSLINQKTGGIYDGLEKNGPNLNQGAESILSYLLAYSSLI